MRRFEFAMNNVAEKLVGSFENVGIIQPERKDFHLLNFILKWLECKLIISV